MGGQHELARRYGSRSLARIDGLRQTAKGLRSGREEDQHLLLAFDTVAG